MPFFSVPPPNNSSRTSLSERKKSSYTTASSSSEPAMSVDENEKDHHSRSLKRGLSKRAKKVRRFFKRMGRHRDEHDIDTLNENLSSLDVANMTSTSSFRTTTTISTSSGGHDSLHDHDDNDDTPSHNTKDSKFSSDDKTTAAEQQEDGQSNHVDRQPTPTAAEEYGVSDTKQSRKPITTTSIPELTPPISPTSATTSPPNSCYSIDRRVDDAVVDELSLRKNDHASYKQPQIIVSPSDSTPSTSFELPTNSAHQQEQPSSPATTKDAIVDDSKESMIAPHTKENEQQMIDIKENQQEEQVNKENAPLEQAIQEPVAQEEEKPYQKEEALTTQQEEKVQSASTKPAQTQGQEPYVISSSNDGSSNNKHEDTSSHIQVEEQQHPLEKETSSVAENDALAIQKEEHALTQGPLSKDQKASTTAPEEEQPPSPSPLASVNEEETPIKENQEEEPIMNDQVSESPKIEEQQPLLSMVQEPSSADPATAVVKEDQEEHQPLLVTQELPSSTDAAAAVIAKQDDKILDTTDNKEEISPSESNNEHKDANCSSKTMTHMDHETSCKESEKQDNDAMCQRVAYFDKKRTGRISMLDTFTSLRGLGYHWLVAIPATFIVHLRLSPLTMPSHRPFSIKEYLLLPIYTERVAQALHTPILAAQRQRLGQWVQMYGHRHGNVYGLGFWGGFRTLGAAESNSTLRWWQLRSRMIHRLQWILTYTMLYDPNARMVTQPTLEGLCNRQLPS